MAPLFFFIHYEGRDALKGDPMTLQQLLITEELVNHMKAAFPPKPYTPGMSLEEVAYAEGTQAPIQRLERLLQKRNARGR